MPPESAVRNKDKRRTYRRGGGGSGVVPLPQNRKSRPASETSRQNPGAPIKIQGVFFFDPKSSTHDQFRAFLWDGIRFLGNQADAQGLSLEKKILLLNKAFDSFHKGANDWWAKLKQLANEDTQCPQDTAEVYMAQPESLEAFEDNKPTPIEYDYQPDYDFVSPDEPQ